MQSSGMLRRVALVRTNVPDELCVSSQLPSLATAEVPSSPILVTLMMEAITLLRNVPYESHML
jgi:hypothetical protein